MENLFRSHDGSREAQWRPHQFGTSGLCHQWGRQVYGVFVSDGCLFKLPHTYNEERNTGYGVNVGNIDRFNSEISKLQEVVQLWPPQDQMPDKFELIKRLDLVAARRTYSARPVTQRLTDVGDFDISRVVLKRTHSDMGQHVILPQDGRVKYTQEYVEGHSEIPGCIWLVQSYVDTLAALGEWRVFIIGGQIVYIVHTRRNRTKGSWTAQTPINYYTLGELR